MAETITGIAGLKEREGAAPRLLRLARDHPGAHQPVRGSDRRLPVDPCRSGAGEGRSVRHDHRARLPHTVDRADARAPGSPNGGLPDGRELRLRQGAVPPHRCRSARTCASAWSSRAWRNWLRARPRSPTCTRSRWRVPRSPRASPRSSSASTSDPLGGRARCHGDGAAADGHRGLPSQPGHHPTPGVDSVTARDCRQRRSRFSIPLPRRGDGRVRAGSGLLVHRPDHESDCRAVDNLGW
jgi:hypothetical protein